jgi:voltage-gated potassium channel Kch
LLLKNVNSLLGFHMSINKFTKWTKYKFDNLMSKSTLAPLLLLLVTVFLLVSLTAAIMYFTSSVPYQDQVINGVSGGDDIEFFDIFYIIILRMLDPGVVSDDPLNWQFLTFMLFATVGGLFMVSTLIAIVNSSVIRKISDLRKGKSFVVEKNHTVILGWSFQVFPIISELIVANENQKNMCIAILAQKDKVEMEDEIKIHVGDTLNTKVVCRTGNPIDIHDLEIINPHDARSIIIIAPDTKDPDSMVIKTILAITNNPNRPEAPHKYHIVAEVRDPRNVPIAEIAGREEVQLVIFDYLISRITAQTCRQPGLSVVFTELLDFSGDEIYFQEEESLVGRTFIEAMFSYDTSTIIGIRRNDGDLLMKPKFDMLIEKGDKLIAISEDDDTIIPSGINEFGIINDAMRKKVDEYETLPETTLIIGWNRRAPLIINELDEYVAPGSKITILAEDKNAEDQLAFFCGDLENQSVRFWYGDTTNRKILDQLTVENYDHIIVLSMTDSEEGSDIQGTDARTLNTLLHLRDISDRSGNEFSIVSEMLDDRNRELAEITHTDDFIVSVKLDSLMLSQISENKELKTIFEGLFSAGPPSIYIMPAENYVELHRAVNFYTVMESGRQQNQIPIGYKLKNPAQKTKEEYVLAHGVVVNPKKSNQIFFSEGDKIIVLSDEDISTWNISSKKPVKNII